MERQLVAPTIDQWRAIQRERRAMAEQYRPYEQPHAAQSRNRQLLRITSDTPDEETGFYPAVWLQSDATDQTHTDQAEVWAWLIVGTGGEDAFAEGEHVGTHTDGTPVFRSWLVDEGFPDVLRVVTNVCDIGEVSGNKFISEDSYEIDTEGGQAVVVGEINAKAGTVTVKAVIDWTDPGFNARTGDTFGFYLVADGVTYNGAPVHLVTFVGNSASMQKEMTWQVEVGENKTITLAVWAFRVAGSGSLTVASTSYLDAGSDVSGSKVEYRQVILNGAFIGPKICVTNPKDCCVEDDASNQDTASDITVSCCSVAIPTMRVVDLTGITFNQPGWVGVFNGAWNCDELIEAIAEALNGVHYLPYVGEVTNTRIRCVYRKNIYLPSAFGRSAQGFWPPSGPPIGDISTVYYPTFRVQIEFYISERLPGETSMFFDWTPNPSNFGQPYGYISAPEYQAHCALGVGLYTEAGPWNGPFVAGFSWEPHYKKEFHATQNTLLGTEVLTPYSNTLPLPATSCAGTCRLWQPSGPFQTTEPVVYPWKVTVDPV